MRNMTLALVALVASCGTTEPEATPAVDAGIDAAHLVAPDAHPTVDAMVPDAVPPAPDAKVEVCNGLDDDGDGVIDNGFECPLASTRPCTTACGGAGEQVCGTDCTWPTTGDAFTICPIPGGGGMCDPITQTGCESCPLADYQTCYVNEVAPESPMPGEPPLGDPLGFARCYPDAGTLVEGQTCMSSSACVPGLTCDGGVLDVSLSEGTCRLVCEMGTVCNPDTGEMCQMRWGWGARWGVCRG